MKELQKEEAIKRMKQLKLSDNVVNDFIEKGTLYYSERQSSFFDGILYWVSNRDDLVKIIKDFEAQYNALVYHYQLTHTEFGEMFTLLYVSKYKSEWKTDFNDLKDGQVLAYVESDYGGEFGYVGVSPKNGGISRTW